MSRRAFLGAAYGVGLATALGPWRAAHAAAPRFARGRAVILREPVGHPLRLAVPAVPDGLALEARPGRADVGGGLLTDAWMLNGQLPSPLLRVRRGDRFRVDLANQLTDDLILHWHGLTPPEHSDGHPRFAVGAGGTYRYDFVVEDRAGTYWYHSHTHLKVGEHSYRGIGGMIVVEDDEEEALGLPGGERDIPVILQDRVLDEEGRPVFELRGGHLLDGYVGTEPFGNGIHRPYLEVDSGVYRMRVLNGSNARIFRMARSDAEPLVVIGNDGGLLDRPRTVDYVDIAPAERIDLWLDLGGLRAGEQLTLRSLAFENANANGTIGLQGTPLELLDLRVTREEDGQRPRLPDRLSMAPLPDPAVATRERRFLLTSQRDFLSRSMMSHQINGRDFRMNEVDERVPFGQTELWTLENDSDFAHPMHLHATHFRVVGRQGGRGQVMPWEAGLKDTVLLYPGETVQLAVRFSAHRGLYLLHCHNLEHEDVGMMMNVLVD